MNTPILKPKPKTVEPEQPSKTELLPIVSLPDDDLKPTINFSAKAVYLY